MSHVSPVSSDGQIMEPTLRDLSEPLIDHEEGQLFLNEAFKIIVEEVFCKGTDVKQKVCEWKEPDELAQQLDLQLRDTGEPQGRLLQRVRDVAKYSIKTSHPHFFNQQFGGVDYHSLAGRFLTEALNTNLGRMIPEDLDEKIELSKSLGAVPFFVSCTSGTTVQGAFDPLDSIADVCNKHDLWMHVDAAWGGSVLFSKQHKHLMKGADRANSVAWNPHKMLVAGLQCSVLLLKDTTNLLKQCHSAKASYLFQQDKFYDVNLDIGDKSVQCSRKVDCLKLWLMWKAVGSTGLEERVDKAFLHVRYLVEQMKKRDGFLLLREPEFVNVCFWFIPPSLRGREGNADYQNRLAKVAPIIKERMMKQGTMMVGYQPLGNKVNFFRVTVFSPLISHKDLDFFLDEIERLGKDL
ncbi:cysteine sulfinic acid decarboxylase isoform X2 [Leuresthes tenuis]|uniref:cysteine sulfinic acid decarboxylase isoform X2 n=1 Tax=Leuresthes tenuis TaxID=355514 RepID=UPI003B504E54